MTHSTICLSMIVKDEAHVIRRCLASVLPFIDNWCIVDTGSTDGTQQVIRETMANLPGILHERPWINFGRNRTEALELARIWNTDYTFVIDADEVLVLPPGFARPTLHHDAYHVLAHSGALVFERRSITRTEQPWRYEGVLHEHTACDLSNLTEGTLPHAYVQVYLEGNRARDPHKFRRDALTLEAALLDDPRNARYAFYLAQSYRDAEEPEKAITAYKRRFEMGGAWHECWQCLYQIGRVYQAKGEGFWAQALAHYLEAVQYDPARAEPLYNIGLRYHLAGKSNVGYEFLSRAALLPAPPRNRLFIEQSVYDYQALMWLAVTCCWTGRHDEAVRLNDRLLAGALPDAVRDRVEKNRALSVEQLGRAA